MRLRARLAVGIWHETGLFLEMLSRFPASSASSSILQAMREEETVPAGIGPTVLFRCIAKSARRSRVTFAADSLTAAQAAVRRGWFERPILVSALQTIERMMREISPTRLGTRLGGPDDTRENVTACLI
jgi:hypothetical protein